MNSKRIIAIVLAIVIILISFTANTENSIKKFLSSDSIIVQSGNSFEKIQVVNVNGVISSGNYDFNSTLDFLNDFPDNKDIKAILVCVNSPGGGVYESALFNHALEKIKAEKNIPVYTYMQSTAASGGYYISVAGKKIMAHPETITGSIGVIMSSLNFSGLMEKYGVTQNVIKSGKFKDIGSDSRPMSPEDKEILQNLIDSAYNRFVDLVAKGRNMPKSKVLKIADGRIYDGVQAKQLGLVDELGYFEDAIGMIKKDLNLKNPEVVKYNTNSSFRSILGVFNNSPKKQSLTDNIQEGINKVMESSQLKPMYLFEGM